MRRVIVGLGSVLLAFAATNASASNWWGGLAIGLSLSGDVDYVSIEPSAGYWFTPKLTVGGRLILRSSKDLRVEDSERYFDYGASVLTRFFVTKRVFLQGEYEYLNYEFATAGGSTARQGYDSLFGGAGYAFQLSRRSWFSVLGMYNFTWKDDEISPYSEPWVLRAGFGFRF